METCSGSFKSLSYIKVQLTSLSPHSILQLSLSFSQTSPPLSCLHCWSPSSVIGRHWSPSFFLYSLSLQPISPEPISPSSSIQFKPLSLSFSLSLSPLFSIHNSSSYPSFHCSTTVILRLISPPSVRLLDPLCLPASCPVIASVGGLTSSGVRRWSRQKVRKERKERMESKEKAWTE